MRRGSIRACACLLGAVALGATHAWSAALDLDASDLAGNVVNDFSGAGLLSFDFKAQNTSPVTLVVDVEASEISGGSLAYECLFLNQSPSDFSSLDVSVVSPAAFAAIGTVLDTSGDPIAGVSSDATSASIPFDPVFSPHPADLFVEIGDVLGDPGSRDWEIDVSALPAGGGTFSMHLAAVPEPAGSGGVATATLIALRLCARRAKPSRLG